MTKLDGTVVRRCLAQGVAERLRAATPVGQTFSAGVATWDGTETPETLLGRADEALYHAKRPGRDRTAIADHVAERARPAA